MSAKRSLKSTWSEPPPAVPIPGHGGFALGIPPPAKAGYKERKPRTSAVSQASSGNISPDRSRSPQSSDGRAVSGSNGAGKARRASSTPTPELSSASRRTRNLVKPQYSITLPPPDDSTSETEAVDDDGTGSDSPPPRIVISRNKSSPAVNGKGASIDVSRETKIKLKFQRTFEDHFVKKSVVRPTAHLDAIVVQPETTNGKRSNKHQAADTSPASSTADEKGTSKTTKKRSVTPVPTPELESARLKKQKRVKVSPVKIRSSRGHAFGFGQPPDLVGVARAALPDQDDPTRYNDDFCSACGGVGRFLCCEGCPRSFHFTCADPPFDEDNLPEGAWFCKSCYVKRHPLPLPSRGLFSELMDQIEKRNPSCFMLPKSLRERYEGVTTSDFGEYQDVHDLKNKRANRTGFMEEADPYRLTDKNGKPVLCYKCGLSALNNRMIISCDYCALHWHLDCLDPPMSSIATSSRKWMCPNHVGRELTGRRRRKNYKVVNVSLHRGFVNNGDIEVGNDSSDDEAGPENENFVKPMLLHFLDNWERFPEDGHAFDRRIEGIDIDDDRGAVYRLPERGIVLDFIDKINAYAPYRRKPPTPLSLTELDRLVCRPYDEREFVRNVAYLNQAFTPEAVSRQSLSALVNAAIMLEQPKPVETDSVELSPALSDVTKASATHGDTSATSLSSAVLESPGDEERESLVAIQKLIRIKGKDALMKFLLE